MIGKFFYEFGLTIVFAVLISLFVSLTLNPMFSAYFLKAKKTGKFYEFMERIFKKIEEAYGSLIRYSLNRRKMGCGHRHYLSHRYFLGLKNPSL